MVGILADEKRRKRNEKNIHSRDRRERLRNPNEVTDIVRDVLWQIVQAEKDRIAENGK